jgi:hypothetical protein
MAAASNKKAFSAESGMGFLVWPGRREDVPTAKYCQSKQTFKDAGHGLGVCARIFTIIVVKQ